jgi:hypothetical protein
MQMHVAYLDMHDRLLCCFSDGMDGSLRQQHGPWSDASIRARERERRRRGGYAYMQLGVDILKPKPEFEPNPNRPNY